MLLVTLFAGVIVDHADRRRLIVTTQVLLMLSAFILAALTWGRRRAGRVRDHPGRDQRPGDGLRYARRARLSWSRWWGREDLPNAIALNSMIFNGARVVGPAVRWSPDQRNRDCGMFFPQWAQL